MIRFLLLSLNISVCFSQLQLAKWKIRLTNPRRSPPKLLLVHRRYCCAHWAEWFLLRTAIELAENSTIVLEEPRQNFSDIDLCWIGSWEEVCGEAQRAQRATTALGDSLFSEMEMRGGAETTKRFDFLIGTNFSEQAEAITRQCVRYLADEKCTRLGVIFPGSGALPRLVASSLERLEIPHNDGLGHIVPGI